MSSLMQSFKINDSPFLKSGKSLTIKKEISSFNSKGNLKKWYGGVNGIDSYLKTNSNFLKENEGQECKTEVICSILANMMGLPSVVYELDTLYIDGLEYEFVFLKIL